MEYGQEASPLRVLDDLNFSMASGDTVAIIGPSGSGKTTLLQLLAALEQPTSGEITLDEQALSSLSPDQLADFRRDKMGIVFQSNTFLQLFVRKINIQPTPAATIPY